MIKDILLPKSFRNYYIFTEYIVGIDIGKTHINATQIKAHGSSITIDNCWHEPLENNKKSPDEKIIDGLKRLFSHVQTNATIRTALSSSIVVFKTLKLPFTSYSKIKMVINFEVEPLLPFSIHDAVVDFVITKRNMSENSCEILVAAVQKQQIEHHLSLFQAAGLDPSVITVDMFALYGLYSEIPAYSSQPDTTIMIDLGAQSTRLAAIQADQLTMIRAMPQGLSSVAKDISTALDTSAQQALEQMIRFGLAHSDPDFQQAVTNALSAFLQKIQFALMSLTNGNISQIKKILLFGGGAEMHGITQFIAKELKIPCELFDATKLKENSRYHFNRIQQIPASNILSFAAALPIEMTDTFNLRSAIFAQKNEFLLLKQLIVTALLIIFIVGSLLMHLIMQSKALKKEISLSKNETIELLKNRFPSIPEDEDDLESIKEAAQAELKQEEAMWFAFTSQSRASFLEYLLELATRINTHELGFVPEQLTIVDGRDGHIMLKARVRDFEALKRLEQILRESKLFSFVEGQTSPDFNMKISIGKREEGV